MAGVVQRAAVLPTPFVRIGIVWLPMVTLTHAWRYRVRKTSSDIVQESVTAPAAGSACPFVGIVIATVGGPFAGSPGSIPIVKSDGWFVSVQLATRSRSRPGRGADASPMIVFPGSHVSEPNGLGLNPPCSTMMSRRAAHAV